MGALLERFVQCFSGSASGPLFNMFLGCFGSRNGFRNGSKVGLQIRNFGGLCWEPSLNSGTLSGRSFEAFWDSWNSLGRSQERSNYDSPMREPLVETSFFASWNSRLLS